MCSGGSGGGNAGIPLVCVNRCASVIERLPFVENSGITSATGRCNCSAPRSTNDNTAATVNCLPEENVTSTSSSRSFRPMERCEKPCTESNASAPRRPTASAAPSQSPSSMSLAMAASTRARRSGTKPSDSGEASSSDMVGSRADGHRRCYRISRRPVAANAKGHSRGPSFIAANRCESELVLRADQEDVQVVDIVDVEVLPFRADADWPEIEHDAGTDQRTFAIAAAREVAESADVSVDIDVVRHVADFREEIDQDERQHGERFGGIAGGFRFYVDPTAREVEVLIGAAEVGVRHLGAEE